MTDSLFVSSMVHCTVSLISTSGGRLFALTGDNENVRLKVSSPSCATLSTVRVKETLCGLPMLKTLPIVPLVSRTSEGPNNNSWMSV